MASRSEQWASALVSSAIVLTPIAAAPAPGASHSSKITAQPPAMDPPGLQPPNIRVELSHRTGPPSMRPVDPAYRRETRVRNATESVLAQPFRPRTGELKGFSETADVSYAR